MNKAPDENATRKELTQVEQKIAETEKKIGDFSKAYSLVVDPHDQLGSHRSIWSAPDHYRDPFTDATKQLGELTAKRRALQNKLKELR